MQAFDDQGRALEVGPRLGHGGEGEVFGVAGRADLAAKVLYPARRRQGKYEKVQAMVARPPAGAYDAIEGFPVLTWPRALLYDSRTRRGPEAFVGYTMARIQPRDFVPFFRVSSSARRERLGGQPVTWDRLVLLGLRLCHVVRTLHRFGYAVGDLNDRNVLVSRRFTPLFMDTDSFQVPRTRWGHYPSIVGDQMYWAPELLDVDLAAYRGSRVAGDRYALGILLFQLFMNGLRPYQARGSAVEGLESLADKIRAGHYPWVAPRPGVLEPPPTAPRYGNLPEPVRHAFERCFLDGHRRPARRPSADDWYRALLNVKEAGYQSCPRQPRHVYGRDLRACPWCLDSYNPFGGGPPVAARQPRPVAMRRRPQATSRPRPGSPARRPVPKPRRAAKRPPRRPPPAALRSSPARPPPGRKNVPRAVPLSERWSVRGLWFTTLAVAFASPTLFLRTMPVGLEKKVTTIAATLLLVFGAVLLPLWRRSARRRARRATLLIASAVAVLATGAVAGLGRWDWLDYTTGAASLALGFTTFALLERGSGLAFRPRPQGFVHGALGLPAAYLPLVALWTWVRL